MRRGQLCARRGQLLSQIARAFAQFLEPGGQALLRRFRRVKRAQSGSLSLDGGGNAALLRDEVALQSRELFARVRLGAGGVFGRFAQGRQLRFEQSQTVRRFKPCGLGRPFAARHKAVPTAQAPAQCHQPFARSQGAPIIAFNAMDQRKARAQFVRAVRDMGEQAVRYRRGGLAAGPETAIIAIGSRAQRRFRIAPQNRGKRAFVARGNADLVQRGGASFAGLGAFQTRVAVAHQSGMLAFDPGQFGARGGGHIGGFIARGLQIGLARLIGFKLGAQASDFARGFIRRLARVDHGFIRVFAPFELGAGRGDALFVAQQTVQAILRLVDRGLGHAPFGFDPGLIGGGFSKRDFRRAAGVFGFLAAR